MWLNISRIRSDLPAGFRERGQDGPDGLTYVRAGSMKSRTCYSSWETQDRALSISGWQLEATYGFRGVSSHHIQRGGGEDDVNQRVSNSIRR